MEQTSLYIERVNAVISHARQHLTDDLPLEALARVAGFSPFHFHRVFKSIAGESVSSMVTRLRLERAAALLRADRSLSITHAAFASGFESAAVFARTFKRHYGRTASSWDRHMALTERKIDQARAQQADYTAVRFDVTVRELPGQQLACIRVFDSYRHPMRMLAAYDRLLNWYQQRGGALADTTLYGLSQDDPDITPLQLCRFDWCLRVPAEWRGDHEINMMTLPPCTVATLPCQGDLDLEAACFSHLFLQWLPAGRYQPANLPAMEIYRRLPSETGWDNFDMECAIPIEAS